MSGIEGMSQVHPIDHDGKPTSAAAVPTKKIKWWAIAMAKAPCPLCCFFLFVAFLLAVIGAPGMRLIIPPPGRSPYASVTFEGTLKHDAMVFAMDAVRTGNAEMAQQTSYAVANGILLNYFALEGDTIITKKYLTLIKDLEDNILNDYDYKKYCWIVEGKCKHNSILNYFQDSKGNLYPESMYPAILKNLTLPEGVPMEELAVNYKTQLEAAYHFDSEFGESNLKTQMTRSYFPNGLPIAGYKDQYDRKAEQETAIGKHNLAMVKAYVKDNIDDYTEKEKLELSYFGGTAVRNDLVVDLVLADVTFAFFAMVFVWGYAWYHTESLFLANAGMLYIFLTFPITVFVQQKVCGLLFFDFLNILLIYLLLGIGVDDVFVITDAWKQSLFIDPHELGLTIEETTDPKCRDKYLAARMTYTVQRASHAVMATTLTTAGAFAANATSAISPTAQFGIFAAIMIIILYALTVTYFPCVLLIHEKYMRKTCFWCISPCAACCLACGNDPAKRKAAAEEESSGKWSVQAYSPIERFFYNKLGPFVTSKKKPLVVGMAVFALVGIICASQLPLSSDTPQWFPEDHPLQKLINRLQCSKAADRCYSKKTSESVYVNSVMVWGVEPEPDRSGFNKYDDFTETCEDGPCGKAVMQTGFDLSEPMVQQHIYDICQLGRKLKYVQLGLIEHCFMDEFKQGLESQGFPFPVPKEQFPAVLKGFMEYTVKMGDTDVQPFKIKYIDTRRIGINPDTYHVDFLHVSWKMPFIVEKVYEQSLLHEVYEEYLEFEKKVQSTAPAKAGKPFITTQSGHALFIIMDIIDEFLVGLTRGILIALAFALIILSFATRNLIVSIFAFLSVGCITACTIGMMFVYQWAIGIIEAILCVLVVGFCVDYTVHYGIAYTEKKEKHAGKFNLGNTREDRTIHGFFELGTSVFGGGLTTIGASAFLFFCQQTMFRQFGMFICTVIVLSLIFANFFFMPALAWFGPEGTMGDLDKNLCNKNKKEAPKESEEH